MEFSGLFIVAMFAVGMGISFFVADPQSRTSRSLAAALTFLGLDIAAHGSDRLGLFGTYTNAWPMLSSICEAGALVAAYEWILRVGRTRFEADCRARAGEKLLRLSQVLALVYGALGIAMPELRRQTLAHEWRPEIFSEPAYYLFVTPFYLSLLFSGVRNVQLLRSQLDPAERVRLSALAIATPFLISGLIMGTKWGPFTTALGEIIFFMGAVRYHVMQGQRGQFLARFLSPEVARLVGEQGLPSTMQQTRLQLSVVACDLRGFTAFAETAAPEDVIQLLREYHETVGQVVTEFGGMIKDFAGDGILTLVGAPIAIEDHAERAVAMALEMRSRALEFLKRWKSLGLELGIGIGVASGFVTVGTIGGAGRLEYAAIGPAVNLASRLCDRAWSGQVLVDQRTVGLIGERTKGYTFESLDAIELKGFARAVPISEAVPAGATPMPLPATT